MESLKNKEKENMLAKMSYLGPVCLILRQIVPACKRLEFNATFQFLQSGEKEEMLFLWAYGNISA